MSYHKYILHKLLPCATFPENQEYESQLCAECAVSNTLQGVNKVEMAVTSCCCVTKERQKLGMRITNCVELKKPKKKRQKRGGNIEITNTKRNFDPSKGLVKTLYSKTPKHLCVINHNGGAKNEMPSYFSKKQNIQNCTVTSSWIEHLSVRG